ncbi:MAG TPA: type IX secretion system membrane protein PorP/SprF, partial [Bacteroidia bacterium]|nr:type IX secretion system membrane protein PorP/SprF [Bacteroidia bacterium]
VTLTGTTGGTYSSTAGLTINTTTGAITPSSSTVGTYTITYTVAAAGGCAAYSTTTSVTITTAPSATIAYSGSPFCKSLATGQSVTITGTTGGTYSSNAGLTIDATTGAITPSTSTAGTYTVTYAIAEFKPTTYVKVTKAAPAEADITASFIFNGRLLTGLMFRSGDALGALIGINITDQLHVGYSFDWSYGNKTFKYNSGSHELMLSYDFIFKDKARIHSPRYF